ncbi:MAG: hypothetical protein ACLPVY_14480 [Acidimicrobiia bacterium]
MSLVLVLTPKADVKLAEIDSSSPVRGDLARRRTNPSPQVRH